jgi:hypothetical protein
VRRKLSLGEYQLEVTLDLGRDERAGARGALTSLIPSGRESSGSGIALEVPSSISCDNKGACSRVVIVEKIQGDLRCLG